MMKSPYLAAFAALLYISCSMEIDNMPAISDGTRTREVQINFLVDNGATKSSLFTDGGIRDLNLYVWRDGALAAHHYYERLEEAVRLQLVKGGNYSVYAIANMGGNIEPQASGWEKDESSMQSLEVAFPDEDAARGFCPFAGFTRGLTVGDAGAINLRMERIVSRIRVRFCPDKVLSGSDIRITGIRLKDAPANMKPFRRGNRAVEGNLKNGDSASAEDLEIVNRGGEVDFYVYENCWGDLLPGNQDQKKKTPEYTDGQKGPTYIEVECCFGSGKMLDGGLLYRIYPGKDDTGNFDLERNTTCAVTLFACGEGLGELSWRIERDFSYNNFLSDCETVQGHELDGLYMGEVFRARICNIDQSVIDYFGQNLEAMSRNISFRCLDSDGVSEDPVTFTVAEPEPEGRIEVIGLCRRPCTAASLWICDSAGNPLTRTGGEVTVSAPVVVVADTLASGQPEEPEYDAALKINGGTKQMGVFLCDTLGQNLLSESAACYGFDSSVFDFSVQDNASRWAAAEKAGCINISLTRDLRADSGKLEGQAAFRLDVGISNDGESHEAIQDLWDMTLPLNLLEVGLSEATAGIKNYSHYSISHYPFTVYLCDGSFGGWEMAQELEVPANKIFLVVENKSALSFSLTHITLAEKGKNDKLSSSICSNRMKFYLYNCPSDLKLPETLYLIFNEMTFRDNHDFTADGGTVYEKDGKYILVSENNYDRLQTAVCRATVEYSHRNFGYIMESGASISSNYSINDGIRVMTDLRSDEGRTINYDFKVLLEDGSMQCSYVYDCYPLKWTTCLSNGEKISDGYKSYNRKEGYQDYPDVNPQTISRLLKNGVDVKYGIGNADSSHPYYYMSVSRPISKSKMSMTYVCNGLCITHVNGVKRDPVWNYPQWSYSGTYSENYTHTGWKNLTADNMYYSFTAMYNTLYNDSESWYGHAKKWQHHSHPRYATLNLVWDFPQNIEDQFLYNFTFEPVNVVYDNSGYSPTWDSNPYTVETKVNLKSTCEKLPYQMIVLR